MLSKIHAADDELKLGHTNRDNTDHSYKYSTPCTNPCGQNAHIGSRRKDQVATKQLSKKDNAGTCGSTVEEEGERKR